MEIRKEKEEEKSVTVQAKAKFLNEICKQGLYVCCTVYGICTPQSTGYKVSCVPINHAFMLLFHTYGSNRTALVPHYGGVQYVQYEYSSRYNEVEVGEKVCLLSTCQ